MDLVGSGSQYEDSSQSSLSSCSPGGVKLGFKGTAGGSSGGTYGATNLSSAGESAAKAMAGLRLMPTEGVEEESSDSDAGASDREDNEEFPLVEFNPKQFYWVFNPILKLNLRSGFSIEDDINPQDFLSMRRVNRHTLTEFFMHRSTSYKVPAASRGIFPEFTID